VGAEKHIHVDVRVLVATNRNLEKEVKKEKFREDLFFRLAVVQVKVPALRERMDDIPLLANHIIENYNKQVKDSSLKIKKIDAECFDILSSYDWPGNVRELKNVIERAITFSQDSTITVKDLPDHIKFKVGIQDMDGVATGGELDKAMSFKMAKDKWTSSFERDYLVKLLRRNNLNISQAAKEARIDRKSIQRLLKKYDLKARDL